MQCIADVLISKIFQEFGSKCVRIAEQIEWTFDICARNGSHYRMLLFHQLLVATIQRHYFNDNHLIFMVWTPRTQIIILYHSKFTEFYWLLLLWLLKEPCIHMKCVVIRDILTPPPKILNLFCPYFKLALFWIEWKEGESKNNT